MSSCATEMQCVILAGGRGTRMAPFTDTLPKACYPSPGRPFADWQLAWLAGHGVDDVLYSIGHLGDQIRRHVGTGEQCGDSRPLCRRRSRSPGNRGSVACQALDASAVLAEEFLVLYGDSYLSVDVRNVWESFLSGKSAALMSVYLNDGQSWSKANVVFSDGMVTRYAEGPAGYSERYALRGLRTPLRSEGQRSSNGCWPIDTVVDLADTFTALSTAGELAGYEASNT